MLNSLRFKEITVLVVAAMLAMAAPIAAQTDGVPAQEQASGEDASAPIGDTPEEPAVSTPPLPAAIEPTGWLVLPRSGDYRRAALHIDPVEAAIARGDWSAPTAGDAVRTATGTQVIWEADATDRPRRLAGGYAYAEFTSPAAGVMLLEASGCAAVCLNGDWVPGDPYGVGWFRPPVRVREGSNTLVVHLARPDAKPRLVRPDKPISLLPQQATLPDLIAGVGGELVASIPVVNASEKPITEASITVAWGDEDATLVRVRRIESRLITPITFKLPKLKRSPAVGEEIDLKVALVETEGEDVTPIASADLRVRVVGRTVPRTNTFVSKIDGSVQPYAVLPASNEANRPGVLVALHDAGQSAEACRDAYQPLPETHVIAPYGRGQWAFDWEDWSRLDAIEALEDFQRQERVAGKPIDVDRVSLIGRGMGGHGALSIATLNPGRFAAVGIVDGWISFYTQGGAVAPSPGAPPLAGVVARQAIAGDPLRAIENLAAMGVSVRHTGGSDVSVSESRYLRQRLGGFHQDFAYHEADDQTSEAEDRGRQLAWLTARRRRDLRSADKLSLATPDVTAVSSLGWATIQAAKRQGEVARVRLSRDAKTGEVTGSTDNVSRLQLSFEDHPAKTSTSPIKVRLDGSLIAYSPRRRGETLTVARDLDGDWLAINDTDGQASRLRGFFKGPDRIGGFKSVFCCRPILIYGTRGSAEARRWADAKARYDAHLFLYRGNGRLNLRPDSAVRANPRRGVLTPNRSIVLYGNAETNSAWRLIDVYDRFLRRPRTLSIDEGQAMVGPRPESGDDLAVLAVRPRFGETSALIGAVSGTGPTGMRLTGRLRYFWSGLAYPDYLMFGPEAIAPTENTTREDDIRAAGYFDSDWGIENGGILWRDLAI